MTSSETKRRNTRASKQVPLPPCSLTERDLRILQAVGDCGALTAPHISRLLFPPAFIHGEPATHSNCQYRLKLLTAHGYLLRFEQPHLSTDGRKPYVYVLPKRGAQLVAAWRDDPDTALPRHREGDTKFSGHYLEHLIRTNDVRVAILAAVAKTDNRVQLVTWYDELTLRQTHSKDRLKVQGAAGRTTYQVLVPDAYCRLYTPAPDEHTYHLFLEIDRGGETGMSTTGSRRDYASKVRMHCRYYDSGAFANRYGGKGLRILTVTTTETRLQLLKQITEHVGGKTRFWFTTFAAINHEPILTAPIWHVATEQTLRPLLW
jgi:hypothetical protein